MEYKCPYCGMYFEPKRLNQLYCETKHGWKHRNLLKTSTNKDDVKLQLGLLDNLKKLSKFSISWCQFVSKETVASLKLEMNYLRPIKKPEKKTDSDPISKWFEVHGYVLNLHPTGSCTLFVPSYFKI